MLLLLLLLLLLLRMHQHGHDVLPSSVPSLPPSLPPSLLSFELRHCEGLRLCRRSGRGGGRRRRNSSSSSRRRRRIIMIEGKPERAGEREGRIYEIRNLQWEDGRLVGRK